MVQLLLLENYIPTTSYESIANNLPQRSKQQSSVNRNNLINFPVVNNSILNISNPHEPINADHNAPRTDFVTRDSMIYLCLYLEMLGNWITN